MRRAALAALLSLLLVSVPVGAAALSPGAPAAQAAPSDDPLGWEGGYWANESVAVEPSDGLNDTELAAVVNRSMARVEAIRRVEFEEPVPVEVVSRSEFRDRVSEQYSNVSTASRLHQNTKYEALFMLGENESAVSSQEQTTAASVGGAYYPSRDEIVVVSENETAPRIDEITLAQELFHALQFRHFDVDYRTPTRELHNARDGIIEGDGNYVDYLYDRRCAAEWDCLRPDAVGDGSGATSTTSGGSSSPSANLGLLYLRYQPYSDGPPFVRAIRERGGWEAVNEVYADPPASTEQTIHPEKYGVDAPTNVTVPDRSDEAWSVVDVEGSVDYAAFGEAGLFMMLWYPGYQSGLQTQIVPYRSFLNWNPARETAPAIDPFNYTSRYSAGWDGDRLVPYATADSAETNETGYVWKVAWDSPADAREFVDGYRQLLRFHGAQRVGDTTWEIPDGKFADAFHVEVSNTTVVLTNAPTVEQLSAVRSSVTVEDVPATVTATATTADAGGATTDDVVVPESSDDSGNGGVPGFGVLPVVVALALVALWGRRR